MRTITLGTLVLALALGACGGDDGNDSSGNGGPDGEGNDAGTLQELVALPAACTGDADCCVVYETCQAQAFVVLAGDFEAAQELAADASKENCLRCIPPSVEVRCVNGACAGFELDHDDPAYQASLVDHCGPASPPVRASADAGDAGTPGARVLGCGM